MLQLSPYFKAIKRNPHFCPECGHVLELNPLERTWDGAMWRCPNCKWFQLELAPESAKLGERGSGEAPSKGAKVIKFKPRKGR